MRRNLKSNIKFVLFSAIIFIVGSCDHNDQSTIRLIEKSKDNKNQIEKFTNAIWKEKNTIKKESALFLLNNIEDQNSIYADKTYENEKFFLKSGKLNKIKRRVYIDSLFTSGIFPVPVSELYNINDIEYITNDYLLNNIELALKAWNKANWYQDYSNSLFFEYVLPYKTSYLPIEEWREPLYNNYINIIEEEPSRNINDVFATVYHSINKDFYIRGRPKQIYPIELPISKLIEFKTGICEDKCNLQIASLRSIGVPVAMDFTPQWGNIKNGHSWVSLITPNNNPVFFMDKEDRPGNYNGYVNAMRIFIDKKLLITEKELNNQDLIRLIEKGGFDKIVVDTKELPDFLDIQTEKTIAKIFRKTYSIHDNDINTEYYKSEQVPDFFLNKYMKDVTEDYVDCRDVHLNIRNYTNKKIIYLCILKSNDEFVPVHWGEIDDNGDITFTKMGLNVIYFPMFYIGEEFISAHAPFIIKKDTVCILNSNEKELENVKLHLKYPFHLRFAHYANYMKNGMFQGANLQDFSDATDLYKVQKTPFYKQQFEIKGKSYRYIRFISGDSICDLGEIELYEGTRKLEGKPLNSDTKNKFPAERAFDNKVNLYVHNVGKNSWVGIDLGEKKKVTKIVFWPRNNGNCIIPGNNYELLYWNNKWETLGKVIARNDYLEYDSVPKGSVLWLKNLSGGIEERPFIYQGNKQIWY